MTNTVAHRLQAWFTTYMPTRTYRESVPAKAERLLAQPERIHTEEAEGAKYWLGYVTGDHGTYKCCSVDEEVALAMGFDDKHTACLCTAGRFGRMCAHQKVAEEMRLRDESR